MGAYNYALGDSVRAYMSRSIEFLINVFITCDWTYGPLESINVVVNFLETSHNS